MRKSKFWMFLGILCILGGTACGVVLLAKENFDFQKFLIVGKEELGNYQSQDDGIISLNVDVRVFNINLYESENSLIRLDYKTTNRQEVTISENDGTLFVSSKYKWNNLENFAVFKKYPVYEMNLYIPKDINVDIQSNVGNVKNSGLNFQKLLIDLDNGEVTLSNNTIAEKCFIDVTNGYINLNSMTADQINANLTNGQIDLKGVRVTSVIIVDSSNGKVYLNDVETNKLSIDLSNGRIECKMIRADEIVLDSTNASIFIEIIGNQADYRVDIDITNGKSTIGNHSTGLKSLIIDVTNGDVKGGFIQ